MTKHRRKVGRPRKKPGEPIDHRLTPKMRTAIVAMVADLGLQKTQVKPTLIEAGIDQNLANRACGKAVYVRS
jgi:hypothetical protein